jgi:hypothetical protein
MCPKSLRGALLGAPARAGFARAGVEQRCGSSNLPVPTICFVSRFSLFVSRCNFLRVPSSCGLQFTVHSLQPEKSAQTPARQPARRRRYTDGDISLTEGTENMERNLNQAALSFQLKLLSQAGFGLAANCKL